MFLPKIKDKNFRKHCSPVSLSKLTTVRKYCFRNQSLMFPIKYIAWLVQNTTESSRKKEVSHLAKLLYFILSTSFFSFLRPLPTASAQWVILNKNDTKHTWKQFNILMISTICFKLKKNLAFIPMYSIKIWAFLETHKIVIKLLSEIHFM